MFKITKAKGMDPVPEYTECSKEKGFFGLPFGCVETKNCSILTTYEMNDALDQVNIQIYKKDFLEGRYVAMAFSNDSSMGDDLVLSCSEKGVFVGWTVGYSVIR